MAKALNLKQVNQPSPMRNEKKTALALIISILLMIPNEWNRIRGWFEDLSKLKKFVFAAFIALFSVLCLAVVLVPIVWEWIQYLS
jgi:hypothetical protein